MDDYFKKINIFAATMEDCKIKQNQYRDTMEKARLMILEKMESSENARLAQNKALAARTDTENQCWADEEAYGVRSAINTEDLENLAKLKSLLRGLYEKKMPKNCPKHNRN